MGRTEYTEGAPGFVVDHSSITRDGGRQIDWDVVGDSYRPASFYVQLSAAASVDDTTLAVDALAGAVPAGTNLHFGQSKEFARVTANAAAGATELTIEALPTAVEDNDTALVVVGTSAKFIPAGTVMCDLTSGKMVPRAARPGSETATSLLASDATEGDRSAALTGYGRIIGGAVYENLLPEATGSPAVINSTYKTELQTAGVGTGFAFRQYADDTAS